jgi:hypothetical protein
VAAASADVSLQNWERSLRVIRALGIDTDKPKEIAESSAGVMTKVREPRRAPGSSTPTAHQTRPQPAIEGAIIWCYTMLAIVT